MPKGSAIGLSVDPVTGLLVEAGIETVEIADNEPYGTGVFIFTLTGEGQWIVLCQATCTSGGVPNTDTSIFYKMGPPFLPSGGCLGKSRTVGGNDRVTHPVASMLLNWPISFIGVPKLITVAPQGLTLMHASQDYVTMLAVRLNLPSAFNPR